MTRNLEALFDPRSVAILGASSDPSKWGHWLARGALGGESRRSVFLVNRNGSEVLGRPTYRSLADLPERPELVVLSVPQASFEEAVDASLAVGAKALVVISAGLGESGPVGRARERAVVERVRAAGASLLGPNCLGVFDAGTELDLSAHDVTGGPVGLVSQSGNLALEIGLLGRDVGLGFSRFVSLGNQADLEAAELIEAFAAHEPTRAIAVYCEDFRDGRAFARAGRAAVEAGKPVVLLAGGASEAAARAALSHTGALASDLAAVDAACRAAGIERVSSPKELVDLLGALLEGRRPRGRKIALAGDGGGHSVIAADHAAAHRLELPAHSAGGDPPSDRHRDEPRRLRGRRRAGHRELRARRLRPPPLGRGRHRRLHGLLRGLRAVRGRVSRPGDRLRPRDGGGLRADRRASTRPHDVLAGGGGAAPARARHPGVP